MVDSHGHLIRVTTSMSFLRISANFTQFPNSKSNSFTPLSSKPSIYTHFLLQNASQKKVRINPSLVTTTNIFSSRLKIGEKGNRKEVSKPRQAVFSILKLIMSSTIQ